MNKVILALVLLVAVNAHFLPQEEKEMFMFTKFLQLHNKHYDSVEEFSTRFNTFKTNLEKVNEADLEKLSPFMDMTTSEFHSSLNLDVAKMAGMRSKMSSYVLQNDEDLPKEFDWRQKGALNPVKNQKSCGSCWAFSAIANVEAVNFVVNGKLENLSEQQLVDCSKKQSQGCHGGWMDDGFDYLQTSGGAVAESDYVYTAQDGKCHDSDYKRIVKVSGFKDIGKNEDEIAKILVENGPLSIACNASPWQFYTGGIYRPTENKCNPQGINHGIALVGFGEEKGVKFWIIRNSWGEGWGEKGHIRIERGTGACGCNTVVSTATIEKN